MSEKWGPCPSVVREWQVQMDVLGPAHYYKAPATWGPSLATLLALTNGRLQLDGKAGFLSWSLEGEMAEEELLGRACVSCIQS